MTLSATYPDLLRQLVSAVRAGVPCDAAVTQLQTHAAWDTLDTPKARLLQVKAWCAAIKPQLPKPLYQQVKRAVRTAALPKGEGAPSLVKFKHAGVELELEPDHLQERGGVLANYLGRFSESADGTHRLRLGFHMTPEQLVGVANYITEGDLPAYTTGQQRSELKELGLRLGMDGLVEAAGSVLDEDAKAKQDRIRRDALQDLGIAIETSVDAAWQQASGHLTFPPAQQLASVSPLAKWAEVNSPGALKGLRLSLSVPNTNLTLQGLTTLPVQVCWLHQLATLDLSGSALESLPRGFESLPRVQSLELNTAAFDLLPAAVFRVPGLTRLRLSRVDQLRGFEPFAPERSLLQEVVLHGSSSSSRPLQLPDELFRLPALNTLDVTGTLRRLPAAIGQATGLQMLDLGTCSLNQLCPEIGALAQLQYLQLSDNALAALPRQIGRLTALTYLSVSHNALTLLPAELSGLDRLRELAVNHNALAALPEGVRGLTRLETLDARSNQITQLPHGLVGATRLRSLCLRQNALQGTLSGEVFPPSLRVLDLQSNSLTALPAELSLPNLQSLDLYGNRIAKLPKSAAWALPALTNLDLPDNDLKELPGWLSTLPALQTIDATNYRGSKASVPRALRNRPGLVIRQ